MLGELVMQRLGSAVTGSPSIMTTTSEEFEIIPSPSDDVKQKFHMEKYLFYKFDLHNLSPATISINHGDWIYIEEDEGVSLSEIDTPVYSFKIKEQNVQYHWIGFF